MAKEDVELLAKALGRPSCDRVTFVDEQELAAKMLLSCVNGRQRGHGTRHSTRATSLGFADTRWRTAELSVVRRRSSSQSTSQLGTLTGRTGPTCSANRQ